MRAHRFLLDEYSALVGDIYECALEPSHWDDTLTRFVSVFSPPDWDVGALMWEPIRRPGVRWVGTTGLVAHALRGYETVFAGTNVWSALAANLPLGQVIDTDDILTRAEFLKSDFYQHFLKTWGMEQAVFMLFERTADEQLALAMPGPPDRDLTSLHRGMRLIAPHVQRAMRISSGLADARLRAAGAESLLNLGHVAVLALTRNLTVVSHNEKAEKLLSQGLYTMHDRRVLFSDANAQQKIAQLVLVDAPASAAFRVAGPEGIDYSVLAMTIRPQREQILGGWAEGAKVLVSITTPHPTPLLEVDRLRAWFDLTASEARLAAALVVGKTLKIYAEERAVSIEAARFLLKGVFRKTGAGSQAQLVTLINQAPKS